MAQDSKRTTRVHLTLTLLEANGLAVIVGEGGEGLWTDAASAEAYIGDGHAVAASKRAARKLDDAIAKAESKEP